MQDKSVLEQNIVSEAKSLIEGKWTEGIFMSFGNAVTTKTWTLGGYYNEQSVFDISENTLFDIASVTKLLSLFTLISLHKDGLIDIDRKIESYPELYLYENLQNVYIYELMNFSKVVGTNVRIDECHNVKKIDSIIHKSIIKSEKAHYSDIGIIIVARIVDALHGKNFFRNYSKKVWNKIGMTETFWHDEIPKDKIKMLQSYDNEYKFTNDGGLRVINTPIGIVHDAKSRILGASAHAGIFASGTDINKICRAILEYEVVSKEDIEKYIISNQYDSYMESNGQHYGLMCYKKADNSHISEVPEKASVNSIAMSGYTGCYLLIDFEKKAFVFIGSNRIRNRLTTQEHTQLPVKPYIKATKEYVYRKDMLRNLLYEMAVSE